MSKNQEYAERYANFAMVQMRKYCIPASVTLAQGILESSNGQSRLAQKENNHFGIKATAANTGCTLTTNRMKNFAAMLRWVIPTSIIPAS